MASNRVDTGSLMIKLNRLEEVGLIQTWMRVDSRYFVTAHDGALRVFKPREALAFVAGADAAVSCAVGHRPADCPVCQKRICKNAGG